ncbi:MAG TPA: hypothetical protein VGI19_01430 [Candidatus Cybelea sp.]
MLLIFAFWGMPAAALACDGTAESSYTDVTQIYVSTDGLTVPVAVHADATLDAGACPQGRDLWVWRQGVSMAGGQCFRSSSGEVTRCCPGDFGTDDPPAEIFARLVAVLERDRFYDVAAQQTPTSTQSGAVFEIAVRRCAPPPDASSILVNRGPTPNSQTTLLQIVVPLGTKPGTVLAPDVVRLLDDITRAVYQSKWYGQDIY